MKKLVSVFARENIVAALVAGVSFLVYLTTLCRTVFFTDSGELAAVAVTLGIAHPTGYPFFTLLGRLAVLLFGWIEEILVLNLLGALFTACAAGFFVKGIYVIRHAYRIFHLPTVKAAERSSIAISALVAALTLAFSATFWSQSVAVEVYALHLLLIMIITYTFIRGLTDVQENGDRRYLLLFAYVLGLGFTNHMTMVLLAPAFLYLFFSVLRSRVRLRLISELAMFFILGLSVYAYLPIRSADGPLLDWGHPTTFDRFLWHVTGKQYQIWIFSGSEVAQRQLQYYVGRLSAEYHWGVLLVALVGGVTVLRRSRRLLLFLLLSFASTILYSINYDIHDIDSYFLLSYIILAAFVFFGIDFLFSWIRRREWKWGIILVYVFLAVCLVAQIRQNNQEVDQSSNNLVRDFALNALSGIDSNAIVFTGLWDYFVSPSYYFQLVQSVRPDIVIIDKHLLQNRSWYFIQLERNYPWLIDRSRVAVRAFLVELEKFERGLPFDFSVIQSRWQALLMDVVAKSIDTRPVYVDGRVEPEFPREYRRIPDGLFFRLVGKERRGVFSKEIPDLANHPIKIPAAQDLRNYQTFMLIQHALWYTSKGEKTKAISQLKRALEVDPHNRVVSSLLGQLEGQPGD